MKVSQNEITLIETIDSNYEKRLSKHKKLHWV